MLHQTATTTDTEHGVLYRKQRKLTDQNVTTPTPPLYLPKFIPHRPTLQLIWPWWMSSSTSHSAHLKPPPPELVIAAGWRGASQSPHAVALCAGRLPLAVRADHPCDIHFFQDRCHLLTLHSIPQPCNGLSRPRDI